jgi:CheY-like chemotaxis protein
VVADVVSLMKIRADAKGLALSTEHDGPVPSAIVTDPVRLRQILINLVGNAVKFTETGRIRIVTRLSQADPGQPRLHFDIVDTGIGMNSGQIASLFEPFCQADGSASRRHGGTGLGLIISKRLAEMLGGKITATSELGNGSTFTLKLPAVIADDAEMVDTCRVDEVLENRARQRSGEADIRLNTRILLVEDGPDNQNLIGHVLSRAGAETTIVEHGEAAIEWFTRDGNVESARREPGTAGWPCDVVLMDMQMPVMDGYETTRRLREMGFEGPIIALTAHAMNYDRQKCIDCGCDDYLTKPINREQLLQTIVRCRREKELGAATD